MTTPDPHLPAVAAVERRAAGADETARANRRWWDAAEPEYYAEHGAFSATTASCGALSGWTSRTPGCSAT
jgi:hypothetical protein